MGSLYFKLADDFMRVAVIGSRTLSIEHLEKYLPGNTTEIISGGACGIDTSARSYALSHHIPLKEFLPEYEKYGRSAPLKRNLQIVQAADLVLAFWDGRSRGTVHVIQTCRELRVPYKVYMCTASRYVLSRNANYLL